MHNLTVTGYILFRDINERLTIAWEAASQIALRNCSKEVREEPRYIGIFAENKTKARVIKQKDYCKSQKAGISS